MSAAPFVVLQPAFIGDVVLTSPLTRAIAERFPAAPIHLVCRPSAVPIARMLPGVDRVHAFDKRGEDAGVAGIRRLAQRITAELNPPPRVLVPHPSTRSWLLAMALRPQELHRAPPRILPDTHLAKRILRTHPATALADPTPQLRLPQDHRAKLAQLREELVLDAGDYVAMPLGSRWPTKRWPPAHCGALAARLKATHGVPTLYLGSADESPLAEEAQAAGGGIVSTMGCSLEDAATLLAGAWRVIGPDSGLTHIARALGTPTLTLFGPTDPAAQAPQPPHGALSLGLSCAPCGTHGALRCPRTHHRCMRDLTPERVMAELP